MSWLSNWLRTLFRSASTAPVKKRPSQAKPAAPVVAAPVSNHLAWLLKQQPEVAEIDDAEPLPLAPDQLRRLSRCIREIPPMPETWHELQDILLQPDAAASDISSIVSRDPVLTAHLLKTCNSPAYAGAVGGEISNLPLAIARLGLDETTNLIFRILAPKLAESRQRLAQSRHIWMHSQTMSALMRLLAEPCTGISRHDASLIGMLHDIGKLVILHLEEDATLANLQQALAAGRSTLAAEKEILGYNHIDAGMMLALHWQLPKPVRQFIDNHHRPACRGDTRITPAIAPHMQLLNLAHIVLQQALAGTESETPGIWQPSRRSFTDGEHASQLEKAGVPMHSTPLLMQLYDQVDRMRMQFPDLFSNRP